ncbi:MAG: SPOR domain-containing protein, partial [Bacteroidota bacterium]
MQRLLLLLLIFAGTFTLTAQDLYTVRVGVFRDVKATDFQNLRTLGFLYGITAQDQTTEVFVGQFSDQNQATKIASDLLAQGFRNAQAFSLPVATGQEVT